MERLSVLASAPTRQDGQSMRTIYALTAHTSTKGVFPRQRLAEWVRVVIHKTVQARQVSPDR